MVILLSTGGCKDVRRTLTTPAASREGARWTHADLLDYLAKKGVSLKGRRTVIGSASGPAQVWFEAGDAKKARLAEAGNLDPGPDVLYVQLRKTPQEAADEAGASEGALAWGRFLFAQGQSIQPRVRRVLGLAPLERPKVAAVPAEKVNWTDASRKQVTFEDVVVRIKEVRVGNVTLLSPTGGRRPDGPYLQVDVQVTNRNPTRKLDFSGWGMEQGSLEAQCTLVDEHGNTYRCVKPGIDGLWEGQAVDESIAPNSSCGDVIIFEPPVKAAQELRLELPRERLGKEGSFRFAIPRSMWEP